MQKNRLQKFFNYLGVDETCITLQQMFQLLLLLNKYKSITIPKSNDPVDTMNCILDELIEIMETTPDAIPEQEILGVLF